MANSRKVSGLDRNRDRNKSHGSGASRRSRQQAKRAWWPSFMALLLAVPMLVALLGGRVTDFAVLLGAAVLMLAGAWNIGAGKSRSAPGIRGIRDRSSPVPFKLLGAVLSGAGLGLAAALAGPFGLIAGGAIGAVFTACLLAQTGIDARAGESPAVKIAKDAGINISDLADLLNKAEAHISGIRAHGLALQDRSYSQRVLSIANLAQAVVDQIDEDPRDYRQARRFLITYLARAEDVVTRYTKDEFQYRGTEIQTRFHEALSDLETVFTEQNAKLLANDSLELDVKLDVLSQRLRHEGAG